MKYYIMSMDGEDEVGGVAYLDQSTANDPVRRLELQDGIFQDLLASDTYSHLCSERLKELIVRFGHNNVVKYEKVFVHGLGTRCAYFQPIFSVGNQDLFDWNKCLLNEYTDFEGVFRREIIKPALNGKACEDMHLFNVYGEEGQGRIIISEALKKAIESEGMTGISFGRPLQVA